MIDYYNDKEYINQIFDILENKEFKKLREITHHEGNRFNHSILVSYYAYKISKILRFDVEKVTRAALLHDFFLQDNQVLNKKERIKMIFNHPKYALENAKKYFDLSLLEEDIILSHMFPIGKHIPKYFESWIVDLIDDVVSVCEKMTIVRKQLSTATCFLVMIVVNNLQ